MEKIINKTRGSFVRLHGIFGITHKGTMLFTEEAIIITNKKNVEQSQFSKEVDITPQPKMVIIEHCFLLPL